MSLVRYLVSALTFSQRYSVDMAASGSTSFRVIITFCSRSIRSLFFIVFRTASTEQTPPNSLLADSPLLVVPRLFGGNEGSVDSVLKNSHLIHENRFQGLKDIRKEPKWLPLSKQALMHSPIVSSELGTLCSLSLMLRKALAVFWYSSNSCLLRSFESKGHRTGKLVIIVPKTAVDGNMLVSPCT